jgi:predicted enzyme related to lactoylglutathione lyase
MRCVTEPKEWSMFSSTEAFSSFVVTDIQQAKKFYEQTLGLSTSELRLGLLRLHIAGDRGCSST